jgi:hypothetical protein
VIIVSVVRIGAICEHGARCSTLFAIPGQSEIVGAPQERKKKIKNN